MGSFSRRLGLHEGESIFQINSVNEELKNRIWNELRSAPFYISKDDKSSARVYLKIDVDADSYDLMKKIISDVYKISLDSLEIFLDTPGNLRKELHKIYQAPEYPWYYVYDVLEIAANDYDHPQYFNRVNKVLEEEKSGYRFVNRKIMPITNQEEISEIVDAKNNSGKFGLAGASQHLDTALNLFSDRENPDYRNAIKEAISMLESLINILGNKKEFTPALKELNKTLNLHPALIKGISNLYGFTSNQDGIRHAILEQKEIDFDDAKFMIIVCSALFNFLVQKSHKSNLI